MHQVPPSDSATSTPLDTSTRRSLSKSRRRTSRKRYLAATAVLSIAGALVGTGFAMQANSAADERAEATAQLANGTGLSSDHLSVYETIAKAQTDQKAKSTIDDANQVIAAVASKVDATPLTTTVASLASYRSLDRDTVLSLVAQADSAKATVQAAANQADQAAAAAAAAAAVAAQAAAQAAAAQAAEALAQGNTVAGAKTTARSLSASTYGWGDEQFSCLASLWQKESGWNYQAENASSGAAGIPQALPGSKMASIAADWRTNATTQVTWGLQYIKGSYGTPCAAWSHSQSVNWY